MLGEMWQHLLQNSGTSWIPLFIFLYSEICDTVYFKCLLQLH